MSPVQHSSSVTGPAVPDEVRAGRRAAIVTLGCARNDVDSEELAARLRDDGWDLVAEPSDADAIVVNTCGFVAAAKKDSIDTLLAAADVAAGGKVVVAAGCLAERYGSHLAAELPEVDAVLGFDDYDDIGARLRSVLAGERHVAHEPRDRRLLLPITPTDRPGAAVAVPGHARIDPPDLGRAPASGPRIVRQRLGAGPSAPLKLASGCDRRCAFCAIPSFRGSFISRAPEDVVAEAKWLAASGVREIVLVSENSTSYGKDLGDLRSLESLLPRLADVDGIDWIRVSYLQPAEMRPSLIEAIASTPGVVPYFDLSFQHASGSLLRRMRRFGDGESFLELLGAVRALVPDAGVRSNVIVGFPGETAQEYDELVDFLVEARLDAIGVFGYSDEDGTEAATHRHKLDDAEVERRVSELSAITEELISARAAERVGERVQVLVESTKDDPADPQTWGRTSSQGPEVDGAARLLTGRHEIGDLVDAVVTGSEGVDLLVTPGSTPR